MRAHVSACQAALELHQVGIFIAPGLKKAQNLRQVLLGQKDDQGTTVRGPGHLQLLELPSAGVRCVVHQNQPILARNIHVSRFPAGAR